MKKSRRSVGFAPDGHESTFFRASQATDAGNMDLVNGAPGESDRFPPRLFLGKEEGLMQGPKRGLQDAQTSRQRLLGNRSNALREGTQEAQNIPVAS